MSAFSHEDGLRKSSQGRIRQSRNKRRTRLAPQADLLESRRLLVYTALFSGIVNFQGDGADDAIVFENVNGQLAHNRFTAGDPGFNSDFDFDSSSPGDQTVSAGIGQSIQIDMGTGNDIAFIGTDANPASTTGAQFSVRGVGTTDQLIVDDSSGPRNATGSVTYSLDISSIIIADGSSTASISYTGVASGRLELKAGSNNGLTRDFNSVQLGANTTPIQILGGGSDVTDVFLFTEGQTFVGEVVGIVSQFNYASFISPVSVNIATNSATGFSGTFSGVQTVIGGAGNDTLVGGNATSVLLNGMGGNDSITGGSTADILIGGPGDDAIDGAAGDDFMDAGTGTDTVIGGTGNDTIGILNLSSNGGSSITIGGNNALVVAGSTANDGTVTFPNSDVEILNVDLASSGPDSNDNLVVTTTLPIFIRALGNEGDDTLDLSGFVGSSELDGGIGSDQLIGSIGSTAFFPGDGVDSVAITGGNGNDDIRIVQSSTLASIIRNGVTAPFDLTQTDVFSFNGGAGNDTLTFDISGGVPFPVSGFSYDGGVGGNDTLNLIGALPIGVLGTVTYTPASIVGSGNYDLDGRTIAFINLEPINDTTVATNFVFNGPIGPQSYSLVNGPVVNSTTTLQIASLGTPTFELVNVSGKTNIVVNGASSNNTFQFDVATNVSGLAQFTLNAGDGTDSVLLRSTPALGSFAFNLGLGDDTINVIATGLGNNLVTTDGGAAGLDTLNFNTNGQAATGTNTTLTFNGRTLTYAEFEIVNALILTVLNTDDAGFGSFRQALLNANTITGADTITFQIPGTGPFTLVPDTAYPTITETVTIDGYTQAGSSPNTLAVGTNAVLFIQLSGISVNTPTVGASGLVFDGVGASGSVVRGLAIVQYESGIDILNGAANVRVLGNFLGVDLSGLSDAGNTELGIFVGDSSNAIIGTLALADRNLISGNDLNGIELQNAPNASVVNNLIGTNRDGNLAIPNQGSGIVVGAGSPNVTIGGNSTGAGNVISGNAGDGITLVGVSASVVGNRIGTVADGTSALANRNGVSIIQGSRNNTLFSNQISGNTQSGVFVSGTGTTGNIIVQNRVGTNNVGTAAIPNGSFGVQIALGSTSNQITGNLISGNTGPGIRITDPATSGNFVAQNRIGTNAAGTAALPNSTAGISIEGASRNTIGASGSFAGNVISGNSGDGITLINGADRNLIVGNIIGLNSGASAAVANTGSGISISPGSEPGQTIGGATSAARNIISGNGGSGITFLTTIATNIVGGDLIVGNYIGTNSTGRAAIPNGAHGIEIRATRNLTIGGTTAALGNLISGNTVSGIFGDATGNIARVLIQGNLIGTDVTGRAALGNGEDGIFFLSGSGITVGGSASGAGNLLSGNAIHGLDLSGNTTASIAQGNRIGTNIDGTAAIPNQVNVFLNALGNTLGGLAAGQGNLISGATSAGIQVFGSPGGTTNISPVFLLGNRIGTNAAGTAALPNGGTGISIQGETSATIRGNTISSNRGGGIQTVNINSIALEAGTTAVLIAGNAIGTNATGTARMGNTGAGISIRSAGVTIGGVNLSDRNIISANTGSGIEINGSQNLVLGNVIGTNASGTSALGNGSFGVRVFESASSTFTIASTANTIGGAAAGAGNLISGNTTDGVLLSGASTTGNLVLGNRIGTNTAGTAALPNGGSGIGVLNATANTIGGIASGSANLVSGNAGVGVQLLGPANVVLGNRIGTNLSGSAALSNRAGIGILVKGVTGNTIGGSASGAGNLVSGNVNTTNGIGVGIQIEGSSANQSLRTVVQGNLIGTNAQGSAALANGVAGIYIVSGSDNTIGGSTAGARNVLSGNGSTQFPGAGLWIEDAANGNVAIGNYIGITADGSAPLGNRGVGIVISDASNNVVGQGSAATRNVISGNGFSGIQIFGTASSGNVVRGNFIGTDINGGGTAGRNGIFPFGNGSRNASNNGEVGVGVYLDSTTGNTIGGEATGDANVISGNRTYGVQILGGSRNVVAGNFVGTNADGSAGVGNGRDGILINGSANNTVANNLSSANDDSGIHITGAASTGNALTNNQIGVTAAGTPLVNRRFGVVVSGNATANTLTGGVIMANGGASNAIVDPSGNGITVTDVTASVVSSKAGKVKITAVKIKTKAKTKTKAKPVKKTKAPQVKVPFANRPLKGLQKAPQQAGRARLGSK